MANEKQSWIRTAVDLIYPRNCQLCREALEPARRGVICGVCLARVKVIEPPFCRRCALPFAGAPKETYDCGYCHKLEFRFERAVAACRAEGVVRDAVHRLKYNGQIYFAEHLADWLIEAGRQWVEWTAVDAVVPVPLHPRKHREREFNQAELLAAALGKAFMKPVETRALRRVKDTATQTRLTAQERGLNMRGAFAAGRIEPIMGKRLVLVDDVFTTGVTLDSCAKVLREAGAQSVTALTVARGV